MGEVPLYTDAPGQLGVGFWTQQRFRHAWVARGVAEKGFEFQLFWKAIWVGQHLQKLGAVVGCRAQLLVEVEYGVVCAAEGTGLVYVGQSV